MILAGTVLWYSQKEKRGVIKRHNRNQEFIFQGDYQLIENTVVSFRPTTPGKAVIVDLGKLH